MSFLDRRQPVPEMVAANVFRQLASLSDSAVAGDVTVPVSPELSIRMERRRTQIDGY
jgi:hypothetical protein